MSTADELNELAKLFECIADQFSETDIATSEHMAGTAKAYRFCAREARERAALAQERA